MLIFNHQLHNFPSQNPRIVKTDPGLECTRQSIYITVQTNAILPTDIIQWRILIRDTEKGLSKHGAWLWITVARHRMRRKVWHWVNQPESRRFVKANVTWIHNRTYTVPVLLVMNCINIHMEERVTIWPQYLEEWKSSEVNQRNVAALWCSQGKSHKMFVKLSS